jgi:surface carbohydrate biosynthesis protein (TIGR04326 family)
MPEYSKKKHACTSLLIWDTEGEPPEGEWTPVLWREFLFSVQPDAVSIPALIETNADLLRKRYLAWVYELGETIIKGRRLVEHLELRPGFSYWWMTLFAEKCNFSKSTQINDAIRLMAFDEWATNKSISRVVLSTANQPLVECIRLWCTNLGVVFEWQRITKPIAPLSWVKRIYHAAPHTLQALLWLARYLIDRWPLSGVGLKEWQQTDGRITFFSYLFNLVPDAAIQSRYQSRYWAHLPEALQQEACKTNWLHLYVKDELLPTSKQAADTIRAFNKTGYGEQNHVTLDTFLSFSVVFCTLRDWCQLLWIGIRLRNKLRTEQGDGLNLWPLFELDWRSSMFGQVAIWNLITLSLFDSALGCLPQQPRGVYLQENQGWEFGLIQAWQTAGHNHLIGTPHSTVRFWDLRYFFDPRSYLRTGSLDLPMPNQVSFNGQAVLNAYKNGGYPLDDLVEVEALRYLHLCDTKVEAASATTSKKGTIRVLVLGDYYLSNTQRQMNLLAQAAPSLPAAMIITVKPHPSCPIHVADYPSLCMTVTMEPISKLLAECDVTYTSSVTSAAVDAYCAGVPVVSVLDPNTLNLSPLRGCQWVLFASTPEMLRAALASAAAAQRTRDVRHEFFTLDPELPRWRKLILDYFTLS